MIIEASGTLAARTKNKYCHMLVHDKALLQLETLSDEVGSTTSEHLKPIILGLDT